MSHEPKYKRQIEDYVERNVTRVREAPPSVLANTVGVGIIEGLALIATVIADGTAATKDAFDAALSVFEKRQTGDAPESR